MTSRGSIDWSLAVLLAAFDDLLCEVVTLSFRIDTEKSPIARISPVVRLSIPATKAYRDLRKEVSVGI